MLDQAARLREMAAAFRTQASSSTRFHRTRVVAVTSGKGGVGKSNMSLNIAHALLASGQEVILLDADLGLANAEILMGIVPAFNLGHLLRGEKGILDLICRTSTDLKLIAGGSGAGELATLSDKELRPFFTALSQLDGQADYLILDTGAGLSSTVQELVFAADQVVVVTTPEPTALADAYGVIKTLAGRSPRSEVRLLVNQAERADDAGEVSNRIIMTARDFLGMEVQLLGIVPRDPHVWQAVRRQIPFLVAYPEAPASRAVEMAARRLLVQTPAQPAHSHTIPGFFDRLVGLWRQRGRDAI